MASDQIGFLDAAEKVLDAALEPLHYREITRRAIYSGALQTSGRTPWATMNAQIAVALKTRGDDSRFVRVRPGVFGLRRWVEDGRLNLPSDGGEPDGQSLVPQFPEYEGTRAVLPAWNGAPRNAITSMRAAVHALRGTPQSQEDWSDPDTWIPERLSGPARMWAQRTWEGSGRIVNPRHVTGHWLVASNYSLLEPDPEGRLVLTERGRSFIDSPNGSVVREIDEEQGLSRLLEFVADSGSASRGDLLEPWGKYLAAETNIRADSSAKAHLAYRLRNLLSRDLLDRKGRDYVITQDGLDYLQGTAEAGGIAPSSDQQLRRLLHEQQQEVRDGVRALLADMDPYAFEHLIRQLLIEIGYEDVEVTSRSNDKGVDVLGRIELGITSVREVVQVKRQTSNIQRPVLDALRGTLHRFGAVRGTIITTGDFSKGTTDAAFEPGAAPITLVSGDKLVELLIEHGIGIRKRQIETLELDPEGFSGDLGGGEDAEADDEA